jgi:flagellar hook-basal body complex protein FliE
LQQTSGSLKTRFELGDPNVDLTQVMLAAQKASLGFNATLQVRNRLVQAYQDVMNMPI